MCRVLERYAFKTKPIRHYNWDKSRNIKLNMTTTHDEQITAPRIKRAREKERKNHTKFLRNFHAMMDPLLAFDFVIFVHNSFEFIEPAFKWTTSPTTDRQTYISWATDTKKKKQCLHRLVQQLRAERYDPDRKTPLFLSFIVAGLRSMLCKQIPAVARTAQRTESDGPGRIELIINSEGFGVCQTRSLSNKGWRPFILLHICCAALAGPLTASRLMCKTQIHRRTRRCSVKYYIPCIE